MPLCKKIYDHCLQKPVHNHSHLGEYDLYKRNGKKFISYALINDFGEAELFPAGEKIPTDVELHEWNYFSPVDGSCKLNSRFLFNIPVKLYNGKLIISHFSLNPNFNLFIKVSNEITDICQDTRPGSRLFEYFDASGENDFGAIIRGDAVEFKLWSPPAGRVQVLFFDKEQNLIETSSVTDLKRHDKGVWSARFSRSDIPEIDSFDGIYYQYLVYSYGEVNVVLDPFALSMAPFDPAGPDKIGKAAVIDREKITEMPKGFSNRKYLKNPTDMVACEAHIRDFTAEPAFAKPEVTGTYVAFGKNIPHFLKTGFTHIQLMPVMKFYTVKEKDRSLNSVNNGSANYNWGYDTLHFFSPEGWFSSDPCDPYKRIYELQNLVADMHQNGLGVIFDVVYNHTYLSETLENIAPGWYYRFDRNLMISGHNGAGASIETRNPMSRRLIVDSLKHYVRYYGADGFRFDLVSFFDHETLKIVRDEVGKVYDQKDTNDLILQGEGWNFTDLPKEIACTKDDPPAPETDFAIFNDCLRDGLMGHLTGTGLLHGDCSGIPKLTSGISGACSGYNPGPVRFNFPDFFSSYNLFSEEPQQTLNFISIHDGFTLWDKINLTIDASHDEKIRRFCQAATVLFTSQGKVIWQGGEEFLRTKPLGENDREPWRAHSSDFAEEFEGVKHFQENSFSASDFTNMIRRNRPDSEKVINYVAGLIGLRKTLRAFSFATSKEIRRYLQFIEPSVTPERRGMYRYTSFLDPEIKNLTLRFYNGPANAKCFICGEVHPKGTDGNPSVNRFVVDFDGSGMGEIMFRRDDIDEFDIGKWGSVYGIQIKLVFTPGQWDSDGRLYSQGGNNRLYPQAIDGSREIIVDLSAWDYVAPCYYDQYPWLAFVVNSSGSKYSRVVVIHNFSGETLSITNDIFDRGKNTLLADSSEVNERGISSSAFFKDHRDGKIEVAENTSVILGIK